MSFTLSEAERGLLSANRDKLVQTKQALVRELTETEILLNIVNKALNSALETANHNDLTETG